MTILVVEDDDSFRKMVCTVLETRGFTVLAAANTGEGLEIAGCHSIDAVLTDFNMPKSNGLEFCRAFARQSAALGQNVPVWIMSGSIGVTRKEAKAAGAEGIFRKPFRVYEISKVIERRLSANTAEARR